MVTQVSQDSFKSEVLDYKGVVFADFYADWCGPCKFTDPIVHELAESTEFKNKIKFVKINVDDNQEIAGQYSVFSIPTFITFKNGQPVNQFAGARDKGGFETELKRALEE